MTRLRSVPDGMPALRVLLRRSKDEGQEFSLDVQREGCVRFGEQLRQRTPPLPWQTQREYLDDGIAGDDFLARAGLRRLIEDLRPGDLVVCRDHSRLGRDALEVTIVVREIVRHRSARLFYYSSGQEVVFNSAIDAATTFIQGVGAQMELEAIRSRTRESLRLRVRQGYIAGGKCYGYTNVRQSDQSGRQWTVAVINEEEAAIVREIYRRYLDGEGFKRIANALNERGIRSAQAGRRGTGSWSIAAIREMLFRERYRGVYIHGQIDRVRRGGKRVAIPAPEEHVIRREIPEWRIIDEEIWQAVQERLGERAREIRAPGPKARYPLTGLARCGVCGGVIGVANTVLSVGRVRAYTCTYHNKRGSAVCETGGIYQPIEEIHDALGGYIKDKVLSPERIDRLISDIQRALDAERRPSAASEVERLERDLDKLRAEQRKLASAVATAPDVPELLTELRKRSDRMRVLESELAGIRRPRPDPDPGRVRAAVRERLDNWRSALNADFEAAHDVYAAVFPDGLTFTPHDLEPGQAGPPRRGRPRKRVWAISGTAHIEAIFSETRVTPPGFIGMSNASLSRSRRRRSSRTSALAARVPIIKMVLRPARMVRHLSDLAHPTQDPPKCG
jgi:site-specific DNA recombinase